ncbi:histidinol phosphate phosphatase [Prevotella melaninogenica]|uniref:HU family DNA-binding protein n=1 Tax=Prevotella melaninogenica TaxID=28132 RepID=UPI001BA6CFAE|nr:histidinol phosphate phosphatase [Prevotella melaninogenica]QUB61783.1 histidinol phosphate phosphatase [Prevotella melaninogenica]
MANKPIQFFLREQKLNIGKQAGKTVIVARPTGRQRVDFRNFCARIAKSTTFNAQEVAAVLNLASETAHDIVANGDIVEFGDMGTLTPSFKSKAVERVEQFRAQQHIEKPVVKLLASAKYFTLNDVTYEQVEPKAKKEKNGKKKAGETEHSGPTAEG